MSQRDTTKSGTSPGYDRNSLVKDIGYLLARYWLEHQYDEVPTGSVSENDPEASKWSQTQKLDRRRRRPRACIGLLMPDRHELRIQALRTEIDERLDSAWPFQNGLASVIEPTGKLVIDVLLVPEHPFTKQAKEFRLKFRPQPTSQPARNVESPPPAESTWTSDSDRFPRLDMPHILFMPQPGITTLPFRQFKHLQLLLYCAAQSSQVSALAAALDMPELEIRENCKKAHKLELRLWSPWQYLSRLRDALKVIEHCALPVILRGNELSCGSTTVELTDTEARFVRALVVAGEAGLTGREFQKENLTRAAQTKNELLKKLEGTGISLEIISHSSSKEGYRLLTPVALK